MTVARGLAAQTGDVSGNSYTENDLGSAELYVYIGDNQAETRPVYFGMINDWRIKNGAKMVTTADDVWQDINEGSWQNNH